MGDGGGGAVVAGGVGFSPPARRAVGGWLRGVSEELGCGFAGDLAVAGFERGGERAGVGGVVCGEVAEAVEGEGACCGGDALGLEVGVVGEAVEDGGDVG